MSRIALLLPDMEMGGAQRVMLMLAREFADQGHCVELVLLSSVGPLLRDVPDTIKVVDLSARSFGLGQTGFILFSLYRLARWMKRNAPEVLLSTVTGANLVALLARKSVTVPTRVVIREAAALKNIRSVLRLKAMRWLYPQADKVIALSPVMMAELIEKIGVLPANIHCIANPVNIAFIKEQGLMPIEHPWLDNEKLKVVISVGRLIVQKDHITLLRAFSVLPQAFFVRLIIVGEGPERAMLEQLAVELGVSDTTEFVGFDANPWRWMARADLFVLSSQSEGHPNAMFEALALDLPVIAAEYDASVRDLAGCYGFKVVPAGKEILLAQAIEEQISIDMQRKYGLIGELEARVSDYLCVLSCSDPILSKGNIDHVA